MKKILNRFTQILFGYKLAKNYYVFRIKNAQEKLIHIKGNKD